MLFDNTKIGFDLKSDFELKRALFLFKVISNSTITKIGTSLLKLYSSIWFLFFKQYDIFSAIFLEQIYRQFCAGLDHKTSMKTVNKLFSKNVYSYLHYSVEGGKNDASFDIHCQSVINSIEFASTKKNLPFTVFKPTAIGRITEYEKSDVNQSIYNRFDRICKIAFEKNIKILIDAEESWVQDSIDNLVEMMMKKYNKENTIVFNTVQMYRHDRLDYLKVLLESAKKNNFKIGVKLVRGAYIEKENKRAKSLKYESPICVSKQATDANFDKGVDYILSNLNVFSLFCGTHNEESLYKIIDSIKYKRLEKKSNKIWLAQLYGMSDHITFNLANENFNVIKYLPWGPIHQVLPYLIRRAEENASVKGQTSRELSLIRNEISRRKKVKKTGLHLKKKKARKSGPHL